MREVPFHFTTPDGQGLYAVKWEPEPGTEMKAIVQIIHGMAEHIGRYKRFAEALTQAGFVVFGHDLRGHGQTDPDQAPVYFHDQNGWDKVIEDIHLLHHLIHEEYPTLPLFLFGHSMGSFLSKCYIQHFAKDLAGVILSGTGFMSKWENRLAVWVAERDVRKYGAKELSRTLAPRVQKSYNKSFQPVRTESDWLSRDPKEVDKFVQDPFCGKELTTGFYRDLLKGMGQMDDPNKCADIPSDLPIVLVSGDQDPVGGFGKSIHKTRANYLKAGLTEVEVILYEGARHELLNETNREEVTKDLLAWLQERIF